MRNKIVKMVPMWITVILAFLCIAVPDLGQDYDYELSWSTIDSGGGQSSGGPYVLTGTIGQPDAAWSSGGPYTLTGTIGQPDTAYSSGGDYELLGGFWPGEPLCIVDFQHFARFAEGWLARERAVPLTDPSDRLEINFRQFCTSFI